MWIDIASIVFTCVTANHLGLVKAIEQRIDKELPIVNCPKCFSYWSVMAYLTIKGVVFDRFATSLAISFLASYIAIWLELFEGFVDILYTKLYETIYPNTTDNAPAADPNKDDSAGSVS